MKLISMLGALALALTPVAAFAGGKSFKDRDWNVSAYENCGLSVTLNGKPVIARNGRIRALRQTTFQIRHLPAGRQGLPNLGSAV